jgi:hypothetical protein
MMLAKDLKITFAFGVIFWQRVVFVCILLSAEVVSRRRSRWAVGKSFKEDSYGVYTANR